MTMQIRVTLLSVNYYSWVYVLVYCIWAKSILLVIDCCTSINVGSRYHHPACVRNPSYHLLLPYLTLEAKDLTFKARDLAPKAKDVDLTVKTHGQEFDSKGQGLDSLRPPPKTWLSSQRSTPDSQDPGSQDWGMHTNFQGQDRGFSLQGQGLPSSTLTCTGSSVLSGSCFYFFFCVWLYSECFQCFDVVGWVAGRASGLWKRSGEVLAWLSISSEVQMICIWSSWCHCHVPLHHLLLQ